MKKQILILAMLFMALVTKAQLKVDSLGRTIIGGPVLSNYGLLQIEDSSGSSYTSYIKGNSNIVQEIRCQPSVSNAPQSGYRCGLHILNDYYTTSSNYGIFVRSSNANTNIHATSYGIWVEASAMNSGKSYGVHSKLNVNSGYTGVAIYGNDGVSNTTVDGRYAGFFDGNVKVSGTINGTVLGSSDLRLKQDIKSLDQKENSALDNLNLLTPISFKYNPEKFSGKDVYEEYSTEELEEIRKFNPEEYANIIAHGNKEKNVVSPVMEKTHFGLVAQELQNVYPELVYQDDNGYLSVNYIELIPILMQSVKELNAKVELQNAVISKLTTANEDAQQAKSFSNETTSVESLTQGLVSMEQNVPNPFSEKTDIAIYLPESVKTAKLCIYDLNGSQISKQEVAGRGETTMTIHADEMADGMYIYALIADGKVVTTRKMVISK